MTLLFNDFKSWKSHCDKEQVPLYQPVVRYEIEQKGRSEKQIWEGLSHALLEKITLSSGLNLGLQVSNGA